MPSHLQKDGRERAVILLQNGWSIRQVAKELMVGKSTIQRIKLRWEAVRSLDRQKGSGRRPPVLDPILDNAESLRKKIRQLEQESGPCPPPNKAIFLKENELKVEPLDVSPETAQKSSYSELEADIKVEPLDDELLPESETPTCSGSSNKSKRTNVRLADQVYCRLCLNPVDRNDTKPLCEIDINYPGKTDTFKEMKLVQVRQIQKMLRVCMPSLDCSLTFNPMICNSCYTNLSNCYTFIQNCMTNQNVIEKYREKHVTLEEVVNIGEVVNANETSVNECQDEEEYFTASVPPPSKRLKTSSRKKSNCKTRGIPFNTEDIEYPHVKIATKKTKISVLLANDTEKNCSTINATGQSGVMKIELKDERLDYSENITTDDIHAIEESCIKQEIEDYPDESGFCNQTEMHNNRISPSRLLNKDQETQPFSLTSNKESLNVPGDADDPII